MSSWYQRSMQVIRRTLATLPPTMTAEEKRKRVSDAYPFGERAMHPYKMWCKAVRSVLGRKPTKAMALEQPIYEVTKNPTLRAVVRCPWCKGSSIEVRCGTFSNSFCCAELSDALRTWWGNAEFVNLFCEANKPERSLEVGIVGDWLMDQGECLGLADAFHAAWSAGVDSAAS